MARPVDVLGRSTPSTRRPRTGSAGPVEGRVTAVSGDGVTFVVPSWDAQLEHGPAPYDGDPPPVGATCLAMWAGSGDRRRPWVLAWWDGP